MRIAVVPDAQVRLGVPLDHLRAAGNYILKHRPDVIVVLGDFWDMESLSRFKTLKGIESNRIADDIEIGNIAMDIFLAPLTDYNDKRRRDKKKLYKPRLVYIVGNHCPQVRIPRYIEDNPIMEGMLDGEDTTRFLEERGFEVHPFLSIAEIGGISFSHYFINPHSAKGMPVGGTIDNMLKNVGFSFVQGHQQGLKMGKHYLGDGTARLGIVAGSFYQHDEDYMNPQGNKAHWRGIIMLNDVKDGSADICEVSLDYLMKRYA